MRRLAVLVLALVPLGLVAAPSPARAVAPALFEPSSAWVIALGTRVVVRLCELVDWAVEDLNGQLDRRRRWDPPPPILVPPPVGVASGGTTTAPVVVTRARPPGGGFIP